MADTLLLCVGHTPVKRNESPCALGALRVLPCLEKYFGRRKILVFSMIVFKPKGPSISIVSF